MSIIGRIHRRFIYGRRMDLLAGRISSLIPEGARVLDVGCGDGKIDLLIMQKRPDIKITGIDVLVREKTCIPVSSFNGKKIPFDSGGFDAVIFIDVLHHADNPELLLQEARRVSKNVIVIKDHIQKNSFDIFILKVMDWVGNRHHGVALPYNYWSEDEWRNVLRALNLEAETWIDSLGLYPWPLTHIFDRSLHFIAKVRIHSR